MPMSPDASARPRRTITGASTRLVSPRQYPVAMAVALALLSAAAYGASDFIAGLASRRVPAGHVAAATQTLGLVAAGVGVLLFPGAGPAPSALEWGALSGVGSGVGTLALYRGLAIGRMTVVATLSAVLTAVLPVLVGVGLGNRLSALATAGVVIAIPAIVLVSWQPAAAGAGHDTRGEAGFGILSGAGFALLFIALDRAGTHSGAWPLVPGQLISLLAVVPFALGAFGAAASPGRGGSLWRLLVAAGVLSGLANLLYLAATGHGALAVVAVLGAMYPAVTVIAARMVLAERWTTSQAIGLIVAAVAIVLVTVG
jgi:uncharacterized membrane protein